MKYPSHLLSFINMLKRLPGVGNKTAERYAFQILSWPAKYRHELAEALDRLDARIGYCDQCGCLKGKEPCGFCTAARQAEGVICVVASPRDAYAIDETAEFKGLFHVLGGLLSPMEGIMPDQLSITPLLDRIRAYDIREVVLALDSTLEGDATALYLKRALAPLDITVSRLAFGIPMGSSLDYIDGGTLARALSARSQF
jgi:recombination protein RecR